MRRTTGVFGISLLALVAVLPTMLGSVRVTGRVIVPVDDTLTEDLYAFAEAAVVEGTIDGDLFVVAGEVTITGTVTGDVIGLVGGPLRISGEVQGAVRAAAVRLEISGSVGDDLAFVAAETVVDGSVGRDVLGFAGALDLYGSVGRDVRAQVFRLGLDGPVGRDVLVRTDRLRLDAEAAVGGDVLYQASADATVDPAASVAGRFTRRDVIAPVWARVVTRLFAVLSLLAFVAAGIVALWAFRGVSGRSLDRVREHPWRSALLGLAVLLVPPVLVLPLFLTLVGIPVALVVLLFWLCALFLGPLPAVTALGGRVLQRRGGAVAALVVGTLLWRGAMWLLPVLAALVYLAALVVGLGAYAGAAWSLRREHPAV